MHEPTQFDLFFSFYFRPCFSHCRVYCCEITRIFSRFAAISNNGISEKFEREKKIDFFRLLCLCQQIAPQPGVLQLQSSESSALPFAPKSEQHVKMSQIEKNECQCSSFSQILPMNSVQRFFAANKIITNANEHSTFPPTIEASPTRDPAAHAAKEDISEVVKDKKVSQRYLFCQAQYLDHIHWRWCSPSLSVASGDDGSESSSTFDRNKHQLIVCCWLFIVACSHYCTTSCSCRC